jgi:hypothetical protein
MLMKTTQRVLQTIAIGFSLLAMIISVSFGSFLFPSQALADECNQVNPDIAAFIVSFFGEDEGGGGEDARDAACLEACTAAAGCIATKNNSSWCNTMQSICQSYACDE